MRFAALVPVIVSVFLAACDDPSPTGSGGSPAASPAERARALTGRPLVPSDVEAYLRLLPESRKAARRPADAKRAIEAEGWTVSEWVILQARVNAAYVALKTTRPTASPASNSADVEVVRPFLPRIEVALRGP